MFILRCLHSPAALTLIVVLANISHYCYAFSLILVDSFLLVLAGAMYSNMNGEVYPNKSETYLS